MSPPPGRSILMQSAPIYASNCVQVGPDCTWVKSRMRTPSSALPAAPHALLLGLGNPLPFFAAAFLGAGFFAARNFTIFFFAGAFFAEARFTFAFFALLFAIFVSSIFDSGIALGGSISCRACFAG